jgi:hypothetical protein
MKAVGKNNVWRDSKLLHMSNTSHGRTFGSGTLDLALSYKSQGGLVSNFLHIQDENMMRVAHSYVRLLLLRPWKAGSG